MNGKNIKILLLRGINVGGKNKIRMFDLRACFDKIGFPGAVTYIASGNVIIEANESCEEIRTRIERALPDYFGLDDESIKVLVIPLDFLHSVIEKKPERFGDSPDKYHSDVLFLIDVDASQVMHVFKPREGVDEIWPGDGVVYVQRLSSQRTKSRMNRIMVAPEYKMMTIRSWNTTIKLAALSETLSQQ